MSEATGVIHDLGFRHYTGPRLGRPGIVRALFLESLRGAFGLGRSTRSKIMPLLLLTVIVLPALIVAVVVNVTGADTLPVGYAEYQGAISPLLMLYVAGQAPASVARDLRFRVVSLYFSRPLDRADYVRAKLGGLSLAVLLVTTLPVLILFVGALLAGLDPWQQTRQMLVALVGLVLLAVLLAGLSLVIAALTPRRGLGVAAVITVLVLLTAVQGVLQALGEEQGVPALAGWSGLLSPFTLSNGVLTWAFGVDVLGAPRPPDGVGGPVYLLVTLVAAAGCYALLVLRYRRVSVS